MSRHAMILRTRIPKETIKFYESEIEACIEKVEGVASKRMIAHCYLPDEKKEEDQGNYRVNYYYSESICVHVQVPECIQTILVILSIDGELKLMMQKTINNEINVITWEESCQFMKYFDKRDLSFFTYAIKCACHFCYYPYADCYTFEDWIKEEKIRHVSMMH